jgi:hypothetical protein
MGFHDVKILINVLQDQKQMGIRGYPTNIGRIRNLE